MKKGIVILLVLVSSAALFAETRGHGNNNGRNNSNNEESKRGNRMEEFLEDATIVTVSGKLKLVNGEMAQLVSGKTTYTIMAPYEQLLELEVKDGMSVTLEGAEWNTPMVWDGTEKMLMATKITISGKTTELDHDDKSGMMGFGGFSGGMMKGKGFRN